MLLRALKPSPAALQQLLRRAGEAEPTYPEVGATRISPAASRRLWTLAPCRIVYVLDEPNRFGFAYGTLPRHPESGEAAFLIQRDETGETVFRIRSFSRPSDPLGRVVAPLNRRVQLKVTRRYLEGPRQFADAPAGADDAAG